MLIARSVIPHLRMKMIDERFAFALTAALSDAIDDATDETVDVFKQRACCSVMQELAHSIISLVSLPKTAPTLERRRVNHLYEDTPEDERMLHDLEVLHQALLKVDSKDNALSLSLLEHVKQECKCVAPSYFDSLVLPFLNDVVQHLQELDLQVSGSAHERFIQDILRPYRVRVVGVQPSVPRTGVARCRRIPAPARHAISCDNSLRILIVNA